MDIAARIDHAVAAALEDKRVVGSVVIVKRDGETLHRRAAGLANRETGRTMQPDAIFRLSSLTKPIVATTVLAMAERGLLRLSDPVTRYLPDFRPKLADGSAPDITLQHLITHTAGLGPMPPLFEDERTDPEFLAVGLDRWHLSLERNLARLMRVPLQFAPGVGWAYSAGIDVLGAVAATLVGGTLGDAVATYVTGPLGMGDTRFSVTDVSRLAAPYADGPEGPVLMGDPHEVANPRGGITTYYPGLILDPKAYHAGGGGMAGTADDFMTLLEMLRTGGGAILSPQMLAEGAADQLAADVHQSPGWKFGYFGAVLVDPVLAESPQSVGTYRWGGIYGHSWFIDPAEELSVVAMTNTGLEGSDGRFPIDIRNAVYGRNH
ncbi:serine hydrolase domain-containing protein [Devosia nitrariae]|uniref:Beta-lactamase/esterase n=1 Tax=Devosia nitrariae TaxID=2071872 RepID=A0ABQ5WDR3_9HYPH|nr:serine hydrolase domain-containing protein [Devosia nitrariae]GLQ57899.1 beta-lactamase/esterase [Devosia nitrariae]